MQHSTQDVTNLTRQLTYFAQPWIGTKTYHPPGSRSVQCPWQCWLALSWC